MMCQKRAVASRRCACSVCTCVLVIGEFVIEWGERSVLEAGVCVCVCMRVCMYGRTWA